MINSLSILFSLAVVVYVSVRASFLDARRPWFESAPDDERHSGAAPPERSRDLAGWH